MSDRPASPLVECVFPPGDSVLDVRRERRGAAERVILAVKTIARDAAVAFHSRMISIASLDNEDTLLVELVGWAIQQYSYNPSRACSHGLPAGLY